ncbi:MAG TPA: acyl carrier protein [Candidatus Acidoferrales bacterium]|jgi:acyl carrier protein|nr:acyl carrier protein [Candidatus Acidoferrales bacterium]
MPDSVEEKVIATLAAVKRIPAEQIKLDSSLQDLGVDSLDTFTLLFELESKFNISIPDDEARNIRTVNDIVTGVQKILDAGKDGSTLGTTAPAS